MPDETFPLFPDEPAGREFVTVAQVGDIPEGEGRAYPVGRSMVAVFLHEGKYFAIDDFCPHQGASLAGGHVAGCVVACPWHHWQFSLKDGTWLENRKIAVDTYVVRVVGESIQVQLPSP